PGRMDYFLHFLCLFWKVVFACIPPTQYWNGWACFCVSVVGIGLLTALIGDLASHFGCTVGLRDSVTALVFVALGTSLPGRCPFRRSCAAGVEVWSNWCAASAVDTFASKVAATQDRHADACVGNVTGSNSVNVFLGIGVAWTVAALYWHSRGEHFRVEPGSLAFSVTLFTVFALLAMAVLWLRRDLSVGGELGGPGAQGSHRAAVFRLVAPLRPPVQPGGLLPPAGLLTAVGLGRERNQLHICPGHHTWSPMEPPPPFKMDR
ncbi:unnamed protein product, partial [Tetraodon nigroviridis]